MTENPRLTVAIPTYNGASHLREALASILSQSETPFDLLVCDDRSDDGTLSIVQEMAGDRARCVVSTERLGLANNWNRCLHECRTELVAIFHQDDVMRPDHLAAHLKAFGNSDGDALGLVASAANVIDGASRDVPETIVGRGGCGPQDRFFSPGAFVSELLVSNPLRCSGVTLRAAVARELGGFDPSFRYVVDWEFWLRIAKRSAVAWLSQPSVAIRWHLASETHRFKTGTADLDETIRLLDLQANDTTLDQAEVARLKESANRILGRAFLNRAYEAWRAGDFRLSANAFRRARELWPGVWSVVGRDPKLAAALATVCLLPTGLSNAIHARTLAKNGLKTNNH